MGSCHRAAILVERLHQENRLWRNLYMLLQLFATGTFSLNC
jgi:hypothetical protein